MNFKRIFCLGKHDWKLFYWQDFDAKRKIHRERQKCSKCGLCRDFEMPATEEHIAAHKKMIDEYIEDRKSAAKDYADQGLTNCGTPGWWRGGSGGNGNSSNHGGGAW